MRVIKYWIIVSEDATELENRVNEFLKQGWSLRGSARYAHTGLWYQTLVKKSDGNG